MNGNYGNVVIITIITHSCHLLVVCYIVPHVRVTFISFIVISINVNIHITIIAIYSCNVAITIGGGFISFGIKMFFIAIIYLRFKIKGSISPSINIELLENQLCSKFAPLFSFQQEETLVFGWQGPPPC